MKLRLMVPSVLSVMFEVHDTRYEGRTYTWTGFDMFRIADGKLVEHWDAATKGPMPAFE